MICRNCGSKLRLLFQFYSCDYCDGGLEREKFLWRFTWGYDSVEMLNALQLRISSTHTLFLYDHAKIECAKHKATVMLEIISPVFNMDNTTEDNHDGWVTRHPKEPNSIFLFREAK